MLACNPFKQSQPRLPSCCKLSRLIETHRVEFSVFKCSACRVDLVLQPCTSMLTQVEISCVDRLESFYVVDANSLAKRAKVPLCNVDKMLSVSTLNGQVFLKGSQESELHNASAMHFFGTYAAPWFLYQVCLPNLARPTLEFAGNVTQAANILFPFPACWKR